MESRLLHAIDAAVERALPAGWPRVPNHRLPARGVMRVRHAFRREAGTGPASYLAIAAVPPFGTAPRALRREITALVDLVLSRGATLVLLYEGAGDPERWIDDHVDCPHPRLLTLACAWDDGGCCTVEATAGGLEPLADTILDLWRGELGYVGPDDGPQTVGVEIMRDRCWRCHALQGTVTGVVFPDREVEDWAAPDWAYFGQLELASVPDALIPALSTAVDAWRAAGETALTVIRWRYSKTMRSSYWAAECPACGAFRGAFPVMEARMRLLGDLESRLRGDLSYLPLRLDVPRQALRALDSGFELSLHARPFGWCRRDGLDAQKVRPLALFLMTRTAQTAHATQASETSETSGMVAEPSVPNLVAEPSAQPGARVPAPLERRESPGAASDPARGSLPIGERAAAGPAPGEEVAASPAPGERASAGSFRRLGQILLPWRGRRRRF